MALRLLLDVNVWIALFDENHSHHGLAANLLATPRIKIATCPLIENGVIRILNLPNYTKMASFDHRIALSTVTTATQAHLRLI